MHLKIASLAIAALFASLAPAQTTPPDSVERVFHVTSTGTEQSINEMATVIRSVAEIPQALADPAQRAITFRGTQAQIAAAEWMFNELDREPATAPGPDETVRQFRMSPVAEGLIRVFYVTHAGTVQEFQEVAVAIRSTAEIRRVFTYNAARAMVVRGTADEIALAEWLYKQLNQPVGAGQKDAVVHEYKMTGTADFVVRVFFLKTPKSIQEFQEMATTVRSTGEIRRVFTNNTPKAVVIRGTPEQIAMADWLIGVLDRPANAQPDVATHEYKMAGASDDVVRVFYLSTMETPQKLQQTITAIRAATRIRRMFTYSAREAAVVRGTGQEIAMAERMIREARQ